MSPSFGLSIRSSASTRRLSEHFANGGFSLVVEMDVPLRHALSWSSPFHFGDRGEASAWGLAGVATSIRDLIGATAIWRFLAVPIRPKSLKAAGSSGTNPSQMSLSIFKHIQGVQVFACLMWLLSTPRFPDLEQERL